VRRRKKSDKLSRIADNTSKVAAQDIFKECQHTKLSVGENGEQPESPTIWSPLQPILLFSKPLLRRNIILSPDISENESLLERISREQQLQKVKSNLFSIKKQAINDNTAINVKIDHQNEELNALSYKLDRAQSVIFKLNEELLYHKASESKIEMHEEMEEYRPMKNEKRFYLHKIDHLPENIPVNPKTIQKQPKIQLFDLKASDQKLDFLNVNEVEENREIQNEFSKFSLCNVNEVPEYLQRNLDDLPIQPEIPVTELMENNEKLDLNEVIEVVKSFTETHRHYDDETMDFYNLNAVPKSVHANVHTLQIQPESQKIDFYNPKLVPKSVQENVYTVQIQPESQKLDFYNLNAVAKSVEAKKDTQPESPKMDSYNLNVVPKSVQENVYTVQIQPESQKLDFYNLNAVHKSVEAKQDTQPESRKMDSYNLNVVPKSDQANQVAIQIQPESHKMDFYNLKPVQKSVQEKQDTIQIQPEGQLSELMPNGGKLELLEVPKRNDSTVDFYNLDAVDSLQREPKIHVSDLKKKVEKVENSPRLQSNDTHALQNIIDVYLEDLQWNDDRNITNKPVQLQIASGDKPILLKMIKKSPQRNEKHGNIHRNLSDSPVVESHVVASTEEEIAIQSKKIDQYNELDISDEWKLNEMLEQKLFGDILNDQIAAQKKMGIMKERQINHQNNVFSEDKEQSPSNPISQPNEILSVLKDKKNTIQRKATSYGPTPKIQSLPPSLTLFLIPDRNDSKIEIRRKSSKRIVGEILKKGSATNRHTDTPSGSKLDVFTNTNAQTMPKSSSSPVKLQAVDNSKTIGRIEIHNNAKEKVVVDKNGSRIFSSILENYSPKFMKNKAKDGTSPSPLSFFGGKSKDTIRIASGSDENNANMLKNQKELDKISTSSECFGFDIIKKKTPSPSKLSDRKYN
jgi:hypothetical protein